MIKSNRLIIILLNLLSFIIMTWAFHQYIVPIYGYTGFNWEPSQIKFFEGLSFLVLISYFLPTNIKKPSYIFIHIHFLLPILPMLVIYGASDESRIYTYSVLIGYLLVILISSKVKLKAIRITKISQKLLLIILILISWLVILSIIAMGGLSFINFDLTKVYDFRQDAADNLPGIYGYISPLTSKILIPFSLLLAVVHKKRLLVLLSFLSSIMMFGLTAHKGPIFYPLMVLGIYFILSKKNVIRMLLVGSLLIIIISLLDFMLEGIWVGNLLLRRTYFVPAHLNYVYYDFFSSHIFTYWSQSKITFGLLDYPYNLDTSHLIGYNYYGSDLTGANTGWLGSGYMNAGFFGIFVYSIILGLLLSLLNAYSKTIDKKIIISVMIIPIFSVFISSDLPNGLLNHGILLALLIISMVSNKIDEK